MILLLLCFYSVFPHSENISPHVHCHLSAAGWRVSGNLLLTTSHRSLSYKMVQRVLQSLHLARRQGRLLCHAGGPLISFPVGTSATTGCKVPAKEEVKRSITDSDLANLHRWAITNSIQTGTHGSRKMPRRNLSVGNILVWEIGVERINLSE